MLQKLPVGVQDFEDLRRGGYLYVDKTSYVYKVAHDGKPYFLSRPRRFGKSLLLSTLRAYWEGRRELFEGLEIERLERGNPDAWQPHPVFYFDFNGKDYDRIPLEDVIAGMLAGWEDHYGVCVESSAASRDLGGRFEKLLAVARDQLGHQCVVLVDEYDKPLLGTLGDTELNDHNRSVFKSFFSTLKKCDGLIRFVFITGVTKFSKVSIFSDLNQLMDISLTQSYAGICGITEDELRSQLADWTDDLADKQGISPEECRADLRANYDGYRFFPAGPDVYNPFSLLNAFANGKFGSYWFESGTPTFLVRRMKETGFNPAKLTDGTLWASETQLSSYRYENPDIIPLFYQTGYLTIKDYDRRRFRYTLGIPNGEVKYGLMECLLPAYAPAAANGTGVDIYALDNALETGDLDAAHDILAALFASIPYTQESDPFEHYFQAVIYVTFTLLGRFVQCELHTAGGRIDCVLETDGYVYLFEFKRDGTTGEALAQIEERGYALPFAADPRKLYRVGVIFDSTTRLLSGWEAL